MESVLTTYITGAHDPQTNVRHEPNYPVKIEKWYRGVKNGVVFHDQLSSWFCAKYPRVKFIKINTPRKLSTNDYRFFLYRDYLREHDIDIFATDLFDMTINKVPELDDRVWCSTEPGTIGASKWLIRKITEAYSIEKARGIVRNQILNAGLWGAKHDKALEILEEITKEIERIGVYNCNMAVFNMVVHNKFKPYTPHFPFHSVFKQYQVQSGANFIHK